jgi:hypothetical protein
MNWPKRRQKKGLWTLFIAERAPREDRTMVVPRKAWVECQLVSSSTKWRGERTRGTPKDMKQLRWAGSNNSRGVHGSTRGLTIDDDLSAAHGHPGKAKLTSAGRCSPVSPPHTGNFSQGLGRETSSRDGNTWTSSHVCGDEAGSWPSNCRSDRTWHRLELDTYSCGQRSQAPPSPRAPGSPAERRWPQFTCHV